MANPTTQLELEMSRELDNHTETDTLRRAQFRMHTLIAAWYDDEPSEPDQAIRDVAVVAATADMIGGWHDDVFAAINMTEARILADLFDELGHTGTADHIMRETWLAESDGDRDPLPWANGHGSRLSEDEYDARSDDLAHNEGRERFHFDPRLEWPEDEG